jgi:hypothetical protein
MESEEFFRSLRTRRNGVPISTLNSISNPSFGTVDSVRAIVRRRSSNYFMAALIASVLATATSTLAPAACAFVPNFVNTVFLLATVTIEPVLLDTDLMAFKVGAIETDTVFKCVC